MGDRIHIIECSIPTQDDDAAWISTLIHNVGDAIEDFYVTWNGLADVMVSGNRNEGTLAVLDMSRPGDDYDDYSGNTDTPTFAWKTEGDVLKLAASQTFKDTDVAEALGWSWPERADFRRVQNVQGWGE